MNANELRARFPNASEWFIRANFYPDAAKSPTSVVERREQDAPGPKASADERNTDRFLVRVQSVRARLLDEDRICEVAVVDCLRYAGIIPGDSPAQARIETTQRKAAKNETEHTKIAVFKLRPSTENHTK